MLIFKQNITTSFHFKAPTTNFKLLFCLVLVTPMYKKSSIFDGTKTAFPMNSGTYCYKDTYLAPTCCPRSEWRKSFHSADRPDKGLNWTTQYCTTTFCSEGGGRLSQDGGPVISCRSRWVISSFHLWTYRTTASRR